MKDHSLVPFSPPPPLLTVAPPPQPPPPQQSSIISAPSTFQFAPQPSAPAAPITLDIKFKSDLHEIVKPSPPEANPHERVSKEVSNLFPGQPVMTKAKPEPRTHKRKNSLKDSGSVAKKETREPPRLIEVGKRELINSRWNEFQERVDTTVQLVSFVIE